MVIFHSHVKLPEGNGVLLDFSIGFFHSPISFGSFFIPHQPTRARSHCEQSLPSEATPRHCTVPALGRVRGEFMSLGTTMADGAMIGAGNVSMYHTNLSLVYNEYIWQSSIGIAGKYPQIHPKWPKNAKMWCWKVLKWDFFLPSLIYSSNFENLASQDYD